jgi:cellobiose phosphorylase
MGHFSRNARKLHPTKERKMSLGYFIDSEKEYVITEMFPKRPLMNFIWNEQEMLDIDHFGFGPNSVYDEKRFRRELYANGDNRLVYILDRKSGEYYSANRNYDKLRFDVWQTRVGQGYTVVESEYNGVRVDYKIFAPVEGRSECWEIKVENKSSEAKSLSVYTMAHLKVCYSGHAAYINTEFHPDLNGLFSTEHGYHLATDYTDCYMASDGEVAEYEVAADRFLGNYGSVSKPAALENGGTLSCEGSCFDFYQTFTLRHNVELAAGQSRIIRVIVGLVKDKESAMAEKNRLLSAKAYAENLASLKARVDMYDDKLSVKTGDETIDRFVNIWLKRQIDLGKTWARGYVVGSRDCMQDVTSFVQLDTKVSREKLLFAMGFVRPNGNIMRAFIPVLRNVSHDCSTWMITAVCQYIKESGDYGILDVDCPYFECDDHGTVLDHLLRASSFLLDGVGARGMTLWGECDWNDSLDGCGRLMKGESVWLAQASVKCNLELIELLEKIGRGDIADTIRPKREKMIENILKYGWEKDHFIYGINDYDEKVGSYENSDAHAYLNTQTWAVLAGILPKDQLNKLMDYVEDNLCCDFGYVQVAPAHAIGSDHIGRSSYFQKGCYENGSVYNHGCAFKIVADCYLKRGNEALKAVNLMLPTNPLNPAEKSGMEPYAISNMYLGPEAPHRVGYSPMHWITGTCGWLFRGIVEYMLGVQAEYDGLKIDPALPEAWKNVSVHRTYRGCVYDITMVQNSYNGDVKITVDGKAIDGNILPYFEDGVAHKVVVNIG